MHMYGENMFLSFDKYGDSLKFATAFSTSPLGSQIDI